jgi:hypothetical protein
VILSGHELYHLEIERETMLRQAALSSALSQTELTARQLIYRYGPKRPKDVSQRAATKLAVKLAVKLARDGEIVVDPRASRRKLPSIDLVRDIGEEVEIPSRSRRAWWLSRTDWMLSDGGRELPESLRVRIWITALL